MFRKTRIVLTTLALVVALLVVLAGKATRSSFYSIVGDRQDPVTQPAPPLKTIDSALVASPCANALAEHAVCIAANNQALTIMETKGLKAFTVVQDVQTGAVVAFAATEPSELDVTTAINPLSLSKLLLAASWWDNRQPNSNFDSSRGTANARNPAYRSRVSVHEMLVGGSDSAGRQMATALRKAIGTKAVLKDFERYGFGPRTNLSQDDKFWGELSPTWETRLRPAPAYVSLSNANDTEWAEALSLGETKMQTTVLHVSRFLQAVGNNGMMLPPVVSEQSERSTSKSTKSPRELRASIRVMQESTALRLQSAMRDTVQRGTADSIAKALDGTGWQIGGRTGSGPALLPKGPQLDGWFAGLIFDPHGKARLTIATFVRSGGYGGKNAAKVSAELARYIIGESTAVSG